MTAETAAERAIRRILIALDDSADSLAALEASAELARELEAELLGLYVEDANLIAISEHTFAREIDLLSGELRRLEAQEVERHLRRQAQRARRMLARLAESRGLRWSFLAVRGRVATEILARVGEVDLVLVGATGRSLRRAPGSTVRALLAEAARPVLIIRRGARVGPRIHALHDGSPAGWEALAYAGRLARREGHQLTVLLEAPEGAEEGERLEQGVREWLRQRNLDVKIVRLAPGETDAVRLAALLREGESGLLVISGRILGREAGAFETLLRHARCPILVVR